MFIAVVGGSGFWLFHSSGTSQVSVKTLNPVRMTIEQKTTATGQIVPSKKVKIKSQANGVLEEILVKPGQWVKQGDLIAHIRLRADPVEINNAQSQINKARLEFQRTAAELERRQRLHQQGLISDAAFQDDRLKFDVNRSSLEQAERDLELRMKGASQQFKTTSTNITATVDGMVLERPVEIGDFIIKANDLSEGTTVVTIADMHSLMFKGEAEEMDAGRLYEGMPLAVSVGALPEESFEATLESIAPEARKTEQGRVVFEIRAAIQPKEGVFLRAGYSATAQIVFARHDHVLTIPEGNLLFHDHEPYVRVEVSPGQIVDRKLTTGLSDGLNIEVSSGLSEQDRVVILQAAEAS
ncbi:MAG: efflux RND transporter periplasmic adaptor subunit [Methylococcaceae bacterium]|nr:efflux RND transporter periplasmic adaptor subunit [Methylococcaceae bacterium]